MMQPLRVPYALEWPDRTCLAQYPIWTPSTLVTLLKIFFIQTKGLHTKGSREMFVFELDHCL